jgi:VWFA-related protein
MTLARRGARFLLVVSVGLLAGIAISQDKSPANSQDVPDAPSAVRPPQPLPVPPAATTPAPAENTPPAEPPPAPPQNEEPPKSSELPVAPPAQGNTTGDKTLKASDDLYRIVRNVNQVIVPVMVKDSSGVLVSGLLPKDFQVIENGVKQEMNYFTSDPFPLSAAVIFDFSMSDAAIQKINRTFPALEGAFSQYDEVSLYTYASSVAQVSGFKAVGQQLSAALNSLKLVRGRNNGPPVTGGPFGPQGPTINGVPTSPTAPVTSTPPREAHVLNDAILEAALDLAQRRPERRKIIFVISEGREYRSSASYSAVLKVLLTNNILFYGIGVESAALPVYGKLQKLHLPGQGTGNILPKYASATGGEVFSEFSTDNIQQVYGRAIGDARNQYTLGYLTRSTPSSVYREIEVKVAKPDCADFSPPCVRVYARDGYYPLPPGR